MKHLIELLRCKYIYIDFSNAMRLLCGVVLVLLCNMHVAYAFLWDYLSIRCDLCNSWHTADERL